MFLIVNFPSEIAEKWTNQICTETQENHNKMMPFPRRSKVLP